MKKLLGAVIGSPITHSLSPRLHNAAFKFLEIQGSYSAIEVRAGRLKDFLLNEGAEFDYLSITMPLKEEALSLPITFDAESQRIQSVNTLIKSEDVWTGSSTDGSGFVEALVASGNSNFENVLILGAGGTARAVAGSLASISKKISVMGRTSTRRDVIERCVQGADFDYLRWNDSQKLEEFDLVVNTTPAGAADLLASSLNPGDAHLLFDVIYKPWPTVLASRWADCGGRVLNGIELLLFQGVEQLEKVVEIPNRGELIQYLRDLLNK